MAEHFIGMERLLEIRYLVTRVNDPIEIVAELECRETRDERFRDTKGSGTKGNKEHGHKRPGEKEKKGKAGTSGWPGSGGPKTGGRKGGGDGKNDLPAGYFLYMVGEITLSSH